MTTELVENRGTFSPTIAYTFTESFGAHAADADQAARNNYSVSAVRRKNATTAAGAPWANSNQKSGRQRQDEKENSPIFSSYFTRGFKSGQRALASVFLPYQYPQSVSSDYFNYQVWDAFQGFFYSIADTFVIRAIYEALGVGKAEATAQDATRVDLLKDACNKIGTIIFGWLKGRAFDYNNKKWRFAADLVTDLVLCFQLTYPYIATEQNMIYIFCGTAFVTAFLNIASSATRVGVVAHQAQANNEGDVKARNINQDQVMKLIGLGISLGLLHAFDSNTKVILGIFGGCVLLHLACNYIAIKFIYFESMNEARLLHALKYWCKHGKLPTLKQVNRMESVILGFRIRDTDVCKFRVRMGVELKDAFGLKVDPAGGGGGGANKSAATAAGSSMLCPIQVKPLIRHFSWKKYLIVVELKKKLIHIVLHQNIQPIEMVEAFVRSVLVANHYTKNKILLDVLDPSITEQWKAFHANAGREGYRLDQDQMGAGDWRAEWEPIG